MAKIRTKARALDLLGRQQIAGIPTALSELFKNAHDAYADNVEVDFYRKNNFLVLRDDGLGMTRQEFEERWLTIGTDSKFKEAGSIQNPVEDKLKKKRPIMGEKGIGRLSIAAIGPQVLIVTKARRDSGYYNTVVAYVNWTIFTLPALELDDIEIPIIELSRGHQLKRDDLKGLLDRSIKNIDDLSSKLSNEQCGHIKKQIKSFSFSPESLYQSLSDVDERVNQSLCEESDSLSREFDVFNEGGTHFIIGPVDEVLIDDIQQTDTNRQTDQSSRLEKALLGFTNTMYADSKPPIYTRFRDHTLEGDDVDRISESIFFTPSEFEIADHHFEGRFDEYGQFSGDISVFGSPIKDHIVPWVDGKNKETLCGPFSIKLAYVQGSEKDTIIPSSDWKALRAKTNRIGGLYIYRDGIRILPYGDSDVDFIRIEQRRSKHASQYFFSYRAMFGAIELSQSVNSKLVEKAGREGFIENKAYKQLKSILENFFIQIAADFFREKGVLSDVYVEQRKRNENQYWALKKRQNYKREKKKTLERNINKFFELKDSGFWIEGFEKVGELIKSIEAGYDPDSLSLDDYLYLVEEQFSPLVLKLKSRMEINRPAGIGFGKELSASWDLYQVEKSKLSEILSDLESLKDKAVLSIQDKYGDRVDLKRRFMDSLDNLIKSRRQDVEEGYKNVISLLEKTESEFVSNLKSERISLRKNMDEIVSEAVKLDLGRSKVSEIYDVKKDLENQILTSSDLVLEKISEVSDQVSHLSQRSESPTSAYLMQVLETQYEHLKEQSEANSEYVQLGMALGVVHHEFNNNVNSIKRAVRDLHPWAKKNESLYAIYERIRYGFEHLESYLSTFTPLTRRLSRKRVEISGRAMADFIQSVFSERFDKENILIDFSPDFIGQVIFGYTSTIYPALVNLVDNSIYWVSRSNGVKKIDFGSCEGGFFIRDSGPGIQTIDSENIFEFGFTRRPSGRGMGLFVTRQTLEADDYRIKLAPYEPGQGACFHIFKV